MPKVSTRQQTLKEMKTLHKHSVIIEDDKQADEMHKLLSGLETKRVLNSGAGIPKLNQYREFFLKWDDEEFVKMCRMKKESFLKLLRLIEDHPVFNNKSFVAQTDVHIQLAVTLRRLSHDGTGNSTLKLFTGLNIFWTDTASIGAIFRNYGYRRSFLKTAPIPIFKKMKNYRKNEIKSWEMMLVDIFIIVDKKKKFIKLILMEVISEK